ncbi:cupin-like domain-containing protein [Gilvimarinus agarilyticus]|uniref:cupin-like domain-containing protein n=1 Tax=Gilvimarinus agarilyticus TaxID=679259 RepID=UPI0018DCC051|nr:cupin-like domain-containing protein [Gilvimarinus agarilyticus]
MDLQEVFASDSPVKLKGLVSEWPAVKAARGSAEELFSYLKQFDAHLPLTVYSGRDPDEPKIGYNADFSGYTFDRGVAQLEKILKQLAIGQERALYIGSSLVDHWLPGFRSSNDIDLGVVKPTVNFWLGNETTIAAHNDSPDNIACCVSGKRRFTLFPPEQIKNLYLGPVDQTPSGRPISLVDFDCPDLQRFPGFSEALNQSLECVLEPGDAIYIPSLWWHHVKGVDKVNMLVNYWWRKVPEYKGSPDLALEHAILALRGLPESQRKAWRAMFDYYVFGEEAKAQDHIPDGVRGVLDPKNERAARLGWLNFSKKLNR